MICVFEEKNSKEPLSPNMVMKDPKEKQVGHQSKYLRRSDFRMIKTIGTGMLPSLAPEYARGDAANLRLRNVCSCGFGEARSTSEMRREQSLCSEETAQDRR